MTYQTHRNSGFSLIELMIAVAVIAILAAIAMPMYQQHVVKTRRGAAAACLMEMAQFMERYHTSEMTYAGASLPDTTCTGETEDHYTIALVPDTAAPATAFVITATAEGAQATRDAECGDLSINQAGTRTVSGDGGAASCF